jgi:hypothetical protein
VLIKERRLMLVKLIKKENISYISLKLLFSGIPPPDQKVEPRIYFFDVVGQANTMFHLFEKQFSNCLIPLVRLVLQVNNLIKKFYLVGNQYTRYKSSLHLPIIQSFLLT